MDFFIVIDSRDEGFYELVSYCINLKKRIMRWFLYRDWLWNEEVLWNDIMAFLLILILKWFYDSYYYWVVGHNEFNGMVSLVVLIEK